MQKILKCLILQLNNQPGSVAINATLGPLTGNQSRDPRNLVQCSDERAPKAVIKSLSTGYVSHINSNFI